MFLINILTETIHLLKQLASTIRLLRVFA